ncbi:hypothetical protein C8R44DRAFT_726349 [Mycena epipterygia]|nr:hypothetical protein C8R44DRAFT_726349 [Mycena epipterygia]
MLTFKDVARCAQVANDEKRRQEMIPEERYHGSYILILFYATTRELEEVNLPTDWTRFRSSSVSNRCQWRTRQRYYPGDWGRCYRNDLLSHMYPAAAQCRKEWSKMKFENDDRTGSDVPSEFPTQAPPTGKSSNLGGPNPSPLWPIVGSLIGLAVMVIAGVLLHLRVRRRQRPANGSSALHSTARARKTGPERPKSAQAVVRGQTLRFEDPRSQPSSTANQPTVMISKPGDGHEIQEIRRSVTDRSLAAG